jgi:hypothetical protein
MTKEEILEYFKDINHAYNDCTRYDTLKRMIDELQEPCADAISRAEVLSHAKTEWGNGHEQPFDYVEVDVIKNLPPVTPQYTEAEIQKMQDLEFAEIQKAYEIGKAENPNKWIPVSERMPEKTDFYLIQHTRKYCPDEMAVAFYSAQEANADPNYTWEFETIADVQEVIAWMPLPEPYKASPTGAESEEV